MPFPSYGYEEVCHIAQETVYGTIAASGWRSFRTLEFGLVEEDRSEMRPSPTGRPVGYVYRTGTAPGPRELKHLPKVLGRVVLECDYEDIGLLIKGAMIKTPTQNLVTGVLTSVFATPIIPVAMTQSLSIVREVGSTFTAKDQQFLGCQIESLRMVFRENEPIRVQMDVIGRRMTLGTAPAATLSATPWMEYHEHSVFVDATPAGTFPAAALASGSEPQTAELFIENRLRAIGGAGQGVRGIRRPIPKQYRRIGMTMTRDFADHVFYDAYKAEGTAGYMNVGLKATSDTNIPGSTPTTAFSFAFHMPAARVVDAPPPYPGGPDIIPETVTFEAAFREAGNEIATATIVNGGSANEYDDS